MDFVAIDMEKLDNSPLSLCEIGIVKLMEYALISIIHISFPLLACPETSSVKKH